jgi:putative transposase
VSIVEVSPHPAPAKTPKYRFDRTDRISIGPRHFVCVNTLPKGHLFERVDDPMMTQFFTHHEIDTLKRDGSLTYDHGFFTSGSQTVLGHSETLCLAMLPEKEQIEIVRRFEYVRRFLVHEAAWEEVAAKKRSRRKPIETKVERTTRGDAVMKEIVKVINAEMRQVDYAEALARAGNKRVRFGVEMAASKGISARTLRRWVTTYEATEEMEQGGRPEYASLALRPLYRNCGNRTPFYDFETYRFIRKYAIAYASRDRFSVKTCHNQMMAGLDAFNADRLARGLPEVALPSKSLLGAHIKALDKFAVYAQRKGIEKARIKFGPTGQGPDAVRPLQRVEMDAWQVHLKTLLVQAGVYAFLSAKQREKVEKVRLWLTVIIDCASRCILAMTLTPTADGEAGIQALAMAMSDKSDIAKAAGALTPWPMTGTMEALFVDNGYSAVAFRAATVGALPHTSITPAALPWLRPYIERLFRTFDLHLMPLFSGRTFANVVEADDYDSDKLASLTTEELSTAFVRYAVDIYHLTPHEGLRGETPFDAWERLCEECAPLPAPDETKFTSLFGILRNPKLTKSGLRVLGIYYQSDELQAWHRRKGDVVMEIRVHPKNVAIAVVNFGGKWARITPTEDGYQNVTMPDYLAALKRERAQNLGKAKVHHPTLKKALRETADLGRSSRRRAGIHELTHSGAEIDKAEQMLRETLHVSPPSEETALEAPAPAPSDEGYAEEFAVTGSAPVEVPPAQKRRQRALAAPKPAPPKAPVTTPAPRAISTKFTFREEEDE